MPWYPSCRLWSASFWYVLDCGGGWGPVWTASGALLVTVGLAAEVVALAWVAPGRLGDFLRRPVVSILIVAAVVVMMILTVWLGVLNQLR
jgi:hypothetical protein